MGARLGNERENFEDENEWSKCKEDFLQGKRIYTSILTSAKKALSITRASIPLTTPTVSTVLRSRPPKTVDMLKPKKPLNKEMNLEEANQ